MVLVSRLGRRRAVVALGLPTVGLLASGALGWRFLHRVRVSGPSMLPTLRDGDRLLVRATRRLHPGDVLVLHDPDEPGRLVVKRAASVDAHTVVVLGDNPAASRDSRTYGPVRRELVVGRAWWRYHPAERAGRLAPRRGEDPAPLATAPS